MICASTALASAQINNSSAITNSTAAAAPAPVAYVYVSNLISTPNNQYHVNGYAAAADGSLTPIAGSPFPASVSYMAVTGHWLFGVNQNHQPNNGLQINSYSIASNGALKFATTTNNAGPDGDGFISLYLDHTGSTLYGDFYSVNNDFLSYSVNHSTGALSFVSDLPGGAVRRHTSELHCQ